jgi:PAS domain S-box-containing protein
MAGLLGASGSDEIAGRHLGDLLVRSTTQQLEAGLAHSWNSEARPASLPQRLKRVTEGVVDVDVTSTTIDFEGRTATLGVYVERRAESLAEVQFQRLFEGNLAGLIIGTPDRVLDANGLFLRMIGRTREEFERGEVGWRAFLTEEAMEIGRRKFADVLKAGECSPFETVFLHKDGRQVPVLVAGMLLKLDPEPRMMVVVVDLTERRQLQEALAEKVKLETVSQLAAGMAHNLNNLMTAVIGNASLLLDQYIGTNVRAYALARDIISAGERASMLVSKLLACAGQGRSLVSAVDMGELIGSEIEGLRKQVPAHISLRVEVAPKLPAVLIAPDQFRQVIEGLLTNAVEAIGERNGEVSVTVRVEHLGAKIVVERFAAEQIAAGNYCAIEVRDNGPGMDAATLSHIFEPFFTTKFTGRGLGLAAIAGIVRGARGAIRVRSTPGVGATFRVYLPAAKKQ